MSDRRTEEYFTAGVRTLREELNDIGDNLCRKLANSKKAISDAFLMKALLYIKLERTIGNDYSYNPLELISLAIYSEAKSISQSPSSVIDDVIEFDTRFNEVIWDGRKRYQIVPYPSNL